MKCISQYWVVQGLILLLLGSRQMTAATSEPLCCAISPAEMERLDKGESIARIIKTTDHDLAILGGVKLRKSKEEFLKWFRNVENFKLSSMVPEAKAFHNPPKTEDLAGLTLSDQELKDIRLCQPGRCGSKLSTQEINLVKNSVDWAATDASQKANVLFRRSMLDYVAGYLNRGNAALGRINDKESASDIAEIYSSLIRNFPYLHDKFPEVFRHLQEFSGAKPQSSDHFIYWSRERYGFGMKPLLNVIHVSIHNPNPNILLIVSKQIRSTHYFDGSLGVTMLVDAPGGAYLIYINRSRIDLLRDAGWFRRTLVEHNVPGATRKEMLAIRDRVEKSK